MKHSFRFRFLPRWHTLIYFGLFVAFFTSSVPAIFSPTNKTYFICSNAMFSFQLICTPIYIFKLSMNLWIKLSCNFCRNIKHYVSSHTNGTYFIIAIIFSCENNSEKTPHFHWFVKTFFLHKKLFSTKKLFHYKDSPSIKWQFLA